LGKYAKELGLVDEIGTHFEVASKEFPGCSIKELTIHSTRTERILIKLFGISSSFGKDLLGNVRGMFGI
jgi:ClpP class serine protease